MEFAVIFALVVMAVMAYWIVEFVARIPAFFLKRRLHRLGEVNGLSASAVEGALGPATCVTNEEGERRLFQWMKKGCHVVLVFNGDVCERISHVIGETEF